MWSDLNKKINFVIGRLKLLWKGKMNLFLRLTGLNNKYIPWTLFLERPGSVAYETLTLTCRWHWHGDDLDIYVTLTWRWPLIFVTLTLRWPWSLNVNKATINTGKTVLPGVEVYCITSLTVTFETLCYLYWMCLF